MQPQMNKPVIQVLFSMAKHGLLHMKRECRTCFNPMSIVYIEDTQYRYIWKCNFCFRALPMSFSTPLCTLNIRKFDIALECWIMNAKSISTARLMTATNIIGDTSPEYFSVFRKVAAHYIDQKILPYLVLPGPIEIDESKTSHRKFKITGGYIVVRWVFGMYCRSTKLGVVYAIKDKSHEQLVGCIKKHVPAGGIIFSDSHMAYCNLPAATSKLAQYGYYHYWTNHSFRFIHEKFPFNNSLQVERMWRSLKLNCYMIKSAFNYTKIQQHCNAFMLKRKICRKKMVYDFMMKITYQYYRDKYHEFLKQRQFDETLCPSMHKIDEIMLNIQSSKPSIGVNARSKTNSISKKVSHWHYFYNIDLEDLKPANNRQTLDEQFDRTFLEYYQIAMGQLRYDKNYKQAYKDIQNTLNAANIGTTHTGKHPRLGKRENWVPVWPQLDGGYDDSNNGMSSSTILNSSTRPVYPDQETYKEIDISSLKRIQGERNYLRQLKIHFYKGQLDMHIYERQEHGMEFWHRDESKYNTKKFNADIDLLDATFSESHLEEQSEQNNNEENKQKQGKRKRKEKQVEQDEPPLAPDENEGENDDEDGIDPQIPLTARSKRYLDAIKNAENSINQQMDAGDYASLLNEGHDPNVSNEDLEDMDIDIIGESHHNYIAID